MGWFGKLGGALARIGSENNNEEERAVISYFLPFIVHPNQPCTD